MSYAPLPTNAQAGLARELISRKRRKIAKAEGQIRDYEARIAKLRSEIAKINDEIGETDCYLSPVRRLPTETLGSIITLCTTDPDAPVQVLRDMCSVCQKWRDTAMSTPSAWTKIDIQHLPTGIGSEPPQEGAPRQKLTSLRYVEEWISRSRTCMKDVTLEWRDDYYSVRSEDQAEDDQVDELTAVLKLLSSRASEIRSFKSNCFYDDGDLRSMPFLRVLDYSGELGDDEFVSTLARSYPRLSCLSVWSLGKGSMTRVAPLQGRLQVLAIQQLAADDLFQLLRTGHGFVGLRALSVVSLETSSALADTSVISMPTLRTLSIGMRDTTPVLKILQMPQLESLALARRPSRVDKITKKEVADLLDFHTTGTLPLRELRLSNLWISDADLLQLLKRSPQLELLAIVNGKTSDKFMTTLSSTQGRPARWICPNLSRVCMMTDLSSKSDKFKVSKDGFGSFVTARLRANQKSTPRGGPPPVARLMDARLDEDDVVFSGILSDEWTWEHDDTAIAFFRSVVPREYSVDEDNRWWMVTRRWEELL